jgi:hypothetical protein
MLAYRGASGINTISGYTALGPAYKSRYCLTGNNYANEMEITVYAGNNAVGTWGVAAYPQQDV